MNVVGFDHTKDWLESLIDDKENDKKSGYYSHACLSLSSHAYIDHNFVYL